MVQLNPMNPEEFRSFLADLSRRYADEHVRAGTWDAKDALDRAHAETETLLPNGLKTPDQFLCVIRDEGTGARVGEVWYCFQRTGVQSQLFVYWIGIEEKHRRRGYASATLAELERRAGEAGCRRVALHVFGDNEGARSLYTRLGYRETNVLMAKPLRP